MNTLPRPTPRAAFLELPRRLRIHFYTSSIQKYLQAKHVFDLYGLILTHFQRDRPYLEREDLTSQELLTIGMDEILQFVGSRSLVFIEDTSLRIEALSSEGEDFPGLHVKEWFANTTFVELDTLLGDSLTERTATVHSDVALHVPGLPDPVYFHGETSGVVASEPPSFEANQFHPWLTPDTFNGWFIPDGASKPLGAMSFEESWHFDFRIKAFVSLVQRLEEYAAIANFESTITTPIERVSAVDATPTLFPPARGRVLVVVGATCSGKTTFALNAKRMLDGLVHIEASAVLRSTQRAHDHSDSLTFARRVLANEGPDYVARRSVSLYDFEQSYDIVITGFRTIEEVRLLRKYRPDLEIVLVDASERTRYARHLARAREIGGGKSLEEFRRSDRDQWAFGLLRVAEDFCDYRVENEGSLEDYSSQVKAVLSGKETRGVTKNVRPQHSLSVHRLYRCLDILARADRPLSCDEIERASAEPPSLFQAEAADRAPSTGRYTGKQISHNNVNKVLKEAPELAERIEPKGERIQYRILPAGRAYLKLMNEYNARH